MDERGSRKGVYSILFYSWGEEIWRFGFEQNMNIPVEKLLNESAYLRAD